jgi:pimeloyl-ACP methyl ester carboxylesterase
MKQKSLTGYLINTAMVMSLALPAAGGQVEREHPILEYDLFGGGSEKVLVLHSWMGDSTSFDLLKPYLNTQRYTYVFADLRGYGRSRDIAGEYSLEEASADALHLANSLGWRRFHLVGHSMSGMIVQRMMIDDVNRGDPRIQSVVAVTPVTADGYPADSETRQFLWDLIHDKALTEQGMAGLTGQRLLPKWNRLQT